jgi:transposase InsO family protein
MSEYTNIFHTLHSKLGIKDFERHLFLKYRSGLHRYIQTNMDFLDISSRKTTTLFLFNHVMTRFGVPQAIVIDHGIHFRNYMMSELTEKLGLHHDSSMPYYPQANGQVEAINKVLITMIRRMIGIHKNS